MVLVIDIQAASALFILSGTWLGGIYQRVKGIVKWV
jgi:hypothetical protein